VSNEWIIRPATGHDLAFIYDSWKTSYRLGSYFGKSFRRFNKNYQGYDRVIDWILTRPLTKILVACSREEQFVVFGYIVYQEDYLHYAFVKKSFRNLGIFNSLFKEAERPYNFSHRTQHFEPVSKKKELNYDPFILMRGQHGQDTDTSDDNEPVYFGNA